MAETEAIVGIYGAVDRAVQADPLARLRVAQLLPQYLDPKLHWYDDFQEWLGKTADTEDAKPAFPDLVGALNQLAETPAEARTRARRMFAIAIATRAFPQVSNREGELRRLAVAALRGSADGEKPDPEQPAEDLYSLLADEAQPVRFDAEAPPGPSAWWKGVIETALTRQAIPSTIGMYPRPCAGRLVTVPGINGPVAALRTELITSEIDFDAATRFIEPVNWETCMPNFWCTMKAIADPRLPDGQRRYREVVSSNCHDKTRAGFWAETELLFNFMWLPDKQNAEAAVANYELAEGRQPRDGRILVDEGTLVVAKVDGGPSLLITTTKRVKFSYPFVSEALSLIMCALGYADVAGDLLACAAKHGKDPGAAGTDFPGVRPTAATAGAGAGAAARSPVASGPTRAGGLLQDTMDIWARALRDSARALERGVGGSGQTSASKRPDRPGS
ncbi:MAG: hypothetical protein JWM66_447 [Solirubrobacterales bacterium]|jgi:hypothetical protein|nr:hypothetical protein [Solirubrobacterales bacterium]